MSAIENWRRNNPPDDAPAGWQEMVPENCVMTAPSKKRQHEERGWLWNRTEAGEVWVYCKWCSKYEKGTYEKFQRKARNARVAETEQVHLSEESVLPKHLRADP